MRDNKVIIYTDGACSGNPGPGGWAAVLMYNGVEKEISGSEEMTTNNRMEMLAVIKALEIIKKSCTIEIYTDSQYVSRGATEYLKNWKQNNWKGTKNKEIKNLDLWTRLYILIAEHQISWHWVRGHSGNKYNERVDALAVKARDQYKNY
jgi:ribonuclease HI